MGEPLRSSSDASAVVKSLCLRLIRWRKTYAVLTRLPAPNRLRSRDAIALLEANWRETPVVHLTASETWRALRRAQRRGVIGGHTYDMLIAACALKADAATIITWNVRHFAAATPEIGIEAPP